MFIIDETHMIKQNEARKLQNSCLLVKNALPASTPTVVKLSTKVLTKKSDKAKFNIRAFVAVCSFLVTKIAPIISKLP